MDGASALLGRRASDIDKCRQSLKEHVVWKQHGVWNSIHP